MFKPDTVVDYISQLLDYYELSPSIVFSETLSYQEMLLMGINKQAFNSYTNHIQQKADKKR